MTIEALDSSARSAATHERRWSPRATALFSITVSLAFWFVAGLIFSTLF